WNVWISRNSPLVEVDDPWGWGRTLEWATSSPPPRFNFTRLPRLRSESPTFDLNHPAVSALIPENPVQETLVEASADDEDTLPRH
ncbi:MAG: cytochrome ubiquinol oxidase subunit I, partial [Propionicimonas sp.]